MGYVKLLDIEIVDGNENKVTLNAPVDVQIKLLDKDYADETTQVIHFEGAAETPVLMDSSVDEDVVSFSTDGFSVYAVVGDGDESENARATINFFGKDTTTPVATFYVKNKDLLNDEALEYIVYDPGVDGLGSKEIFKGWNISSKGTTDGLDYTTATEAKNIDDVRAFLKNVTIAEGDVYNVYAMIFNAYNVQFKDEDGTMIHGETLITKGNEGVSYKINTDYTPKTEDQQFQGWYANSSTTGAVTPVKDVYSFGDEVTIKGDVIFSPNAPNGSWLVFDGNIGTDTQNKPSYTPPQFITTGHLPTEPSNPSRVGYTFGGWYKDEACTEEFDFDVELSGRTTVYAKWSVVESANYTVIIWKQNVALDGYDYAESFTLSGTPNTTVTTVSGSGDTATITGRPGGNRVSYTGFTFGHYDQNVTIKANGTSTVNVYFDRKQYTLTFKVQKGFLFTYWNTVKTITAYYEQDISSNFPIKGTDGVNYDGYVWTPQNSAIYGKSHDVPYIDVMREENTVFHAKQYGTTSSREYRYYTECLPEDTGDTYYEGKQFKLHTKVTIDCKRDGFNATYEEDFSTMDAFTRYKSDPSLTPGESIAVPRTGMSFYYTRNKYPVIYNDGIYVDGDGVATGKESRGNLKTTPESDYIYYQASLESMEDYFTPTYPGYVFVGWYLDESCRQPFDWNSTMPKGGVKVYAKWVAVQYRVFLHANVDPSDNSLDWGGQSMSFRVDEDEKLADGNKIIGTRDDYEIVGWYTDEALTNPFNFDAYTVNSGLPYLTDYDQTESTELNKWSRPDGDTTNHDKTGGRIWITKKLELYAKWREIMKGARGIQVIYDAGEGFNSANHQPEYTDPLYYLDDSNAIAQPASVPTDETMHFVKWHIQKWNGSEWVESGDVVFPGDSFNVKKSNSRKEENPDWDRVTENEQFLYTIKLVAEYGPKEEPIDTHIDWYYNDGLGKAPIHVDKGLQINKAVNIHEAQTRTGFKFLGWAKKNEYETDGVTAIKDYDGLEENDLFLKWDAENEQYLAKTDNSGIWNVVTKVAADEIKPYEALYAVWEIEKYKVSIKKEVINGSERDLTTQFTINYAFDNASLDNGNVELRHGDDAFAISEEVPYGTIITVSEDGYPDFAKTYAAVRTTNAAGEAIEDTPFNPETDTDNSFKITGNTTITVTNTRQVQEVVFEKTLEGSQITGDSSSVTTAVFSLTDGTNTYTASPDENGIVTFEKVRISNSEYALKETTVPTGYTAISEHKVEVTADGFTIKLDGKEIDKNASGVYTINDPKAETGAFTLKKTDYSGTQIDGATFTIKAFDGSKYADPQTIDNVGEVPVKGLKVGTKYELQEIEAPDGYVMVGDPWHFQIKLDGTVEITEDDKISISGSKDDGYVISIKNEAGQALPHTGGSGTLPYTLGGIALIMASALMYGFRMRRRERRLN